MSTWRKRAIPGGDPRNPFDIVSSDSDAFDLLGQSGDDGDSSDMAAWMHGSDMADIENMFPDSDSEGSAPSPPKEAPEKPSIDWNRVVYGKHRASTLPPAKARTLRPPSMPRIVVAPARSAP